jgi:glutamate 5-kinase
MVAGLADADLLVLLSDVDGLFTGDPRKDATASLIPLVEDISPEIEALAGGEGSKFGSGGMATKIAAARIAVSQGVPMALANGSRRDCLAFLFGTEAGEASPANVRGSAGKAPGEDGRSPGTLFLPKAHSLGSRKGWLAFSTRTSGTVYVDEGASKALLEGGRSLLPSGVQKVEGDFHRGEVVEIRHGAAMIARGIANFSGEEIAQIKGRHSSEIEGILGPGHDQEVIHRDNMSPWK